MKQSIFKMSVRTRILVALTAINGVSTVVSMIADNNQLSLPISQPEKLPEKLTDTITDVIETI